jgi:hypothetical protein
MEEIGKCGRMDFNAAEIDAVSSVNNGVVRVLLVSPAGSRWPGADEHGASRQVAALIIHVPKNVVIGNRADMAWRSIKVQK